MKHTILKTNSGLGYRQWAYLLHVGQGLCIIVGLSPSVEMWDVYNVWEISCFDPYEVEPLSDGEVAEEVLHPIFRRLLKHSDINFLGGM